MIRRATTRQATAHGATRPGASFAVVIAAAVAVGVAGVLVPATPASAQSSGYVAVALEVSSQVPREDALDQKTGFGISVRLPRPNGWGFAFDMGSLALDLDAPVAGSPVEIGTLRVRPLLGGIAYTHRAGHLELTGSVTAGWTFGSFEISTAGRDAYGERLSTFNLDADASNRPAIFPKLSVWYDLTSRLGATFSAGYLVVRPDVTIEGTAAGTPFRDTRRVTADSWRFGAGVSVKVF